MFGGLKMKIKKYKIGKQKSLTILTKYVILTYIRIGHRIRIQIEFTTFGD